MSSAKIAVVTGGSAGVGRATVRELASRGYDVAILARGAAGLAGAATDVRDRGRRALAIATDVADVDAVDAAAQTVEESLGPIDLWVNVAFVGALSFFWNTSPADFERITQVTYFGQVNGTRAALRHMRKRDRGVVINVGSSLAFRGIPLQSAYCGAKHAIKGFTESVVTELAHEKSNVKVCQVQLPGLNTPQFDWNLDQFDEHPMPVPPIYQPETAARAIAFLAEHPRRNMWVGIPTAYTILGNRVAPKFLDFYLGRTGVKSQLVDDNLPRFGSNVHEPRDDDEDHGAHGAFGDQAHLRDPVSWAAMHRMAIAGGVATVAGIAITRGLRRR